MMKKNDLTVMKAITICNKPYLKPEEAMIYCNLSRARLIKKCETFGIFKNASGYYKRDELDQMMSGAPSKYEEAAKKLKM